MTTKQLKQQGLTAAQQEVEAARFAHSQLAAEKQQREAELTGRLAALQQECSTLLAVVEHAVTQHAEVRRLASMHRRHVALTLDVGC